MYLKNSRRFRSTVPTFVYTNMGLDIPCVSYLPMLAAFSVCVLPYSEYANMLLENTWYFQRYTVSGIFLSVRGKGEKGRVQRDDFSSRISGIVHINHTNKFRLIVAMG